VASFLIALLGSPAVLAVLWAAEQFADWLDRDREP
jgi:hypothetical protein